MTDLLARIGVMLLVIALSLPNEFSDTLLDGLSIALLVYAGVLITFIVAEVLNVDLIHTGRG